jgi:hypothetical protein
VTLGEQLVGAGQAQPAGAVKADQRGTVAGFQVPDLESIGRNSALGELSSVHHSQMPIHTKPTYSSKSGPSFWNRFPQVGSQSADNVREPR